MKRCYFFSEVIIGLFLVFSMIGCSPAPKKTEDATKNYYSEQYRPQFHFSPEAHWMNDPNGMVYYEGEYHLFYQYFPDSTVWGPMHWGHAVSTDLVHWEHLPIALYPDSLGLIFSGSAVIDWGNTTGFGSKANPPMIAIFTYNNMEGEKSGRNDFQSQGIAYSLDKGRTWTKYSGNPVLPNPGIRDFRDPKVSWNKEINKWIMVFAAHDRVKFYSSSNLKEWIFESDFGMGSGAHTGVWECPDLFSIKVEGSEDTKWVLLVSINPGGPNGGSATQYFVGSFNGKSFIPETSETNWVDWGRDNYAGVTWSDIPESDGRRLFLGWMSNWDYATVVPTDVWRSAMTFPREINIKKVDGKFLLVSNPAKELESIRDANLSSTILSETISGEKEIDMKGVNLSQCEITIDLTFEKELPESFGLILENNLNESVKIGYSKADSKFFIDRTTSGKNGFSDKFSGIAWAPYTFKNQVQLQLLLDASSVELFVDGGNLVMTDLLFPTEPFKKIKLFTSGGELQLQKAEIVGLKRIW
ncbi:MAG TPA: glycoside hydrolase family 32 protein [Prolixibacteraceae bacterium]|nr:glycoside hydrolase family 32 protein [Prolixibacteraceae bacterium]